MMGEEPQAGQIPVVIQITNRDLRIGIFKPSENELTVGKEWLDWLDDLESQFRYFKVTKVQDKKDAITIYGGNDIKTLAKNLPDPTQKPDYAEANENLDGYTRIKWKLTEYFTKKTNYHHAKYLFNKMRPQLTKKGKIEGTVTYATRLREAANFTDFPNKEERIL